MGRMILWWKASEVVSDLLLLGLLGEEYSLDVGEDTTLGNGNTGEEFVQFLVVADGELEVTGDDSGLLVVTGSVACKLENLSNDGGLPLVGSDGLALGTSRSLLCRQDFLLCWQ